MSELSKQLLVMNQEIQKAIAMTEFSKALDLDIKRYAFITTLPVSAINDSELNKALRTTRTDLQAATRQLQSDLDTINRHRRAAAKAHHTYRETIKHQKTVT